MGERENSDHKWKEQPETQGNLIVFHFSPLWNSQSSAVVMCLLLSVVLFCLKQQLKLQLNLVRVCVYPCVTGSLLYVTAGSWGPQSGWAIWLAGGGLTLIADFWWWGWWRKRVLREKREVEREWQVCMSACSLTHYKQSIPGCLRQKRVISWKGDGWHLLCQKEWLSPKRHPDQDSLNVSSWCCKGLLGAEGGSMSVLLTASHCKVTDCKFLLSDLYTSWRDRMAVLKSCQCSALFFLNLATSPHLTLSALCLKKEVSAMYDLKFPSL